MGSVPFLYISFIIKCVEMSQQNVEPFMKIKSESGQLMRGRTKIKKKVND